MIAKVKKEEKKKTEYEVGILYVQKEVGTVILCDRNDDKLRGMVIVPGDKKNLWRERHFIGEYRADWSNTFTKFDGEITLIQ
jgi:hypothetical protein